MKRRASGGFGRLGALVVAVLGCHSASLRAQVPVQDFTNGVALTNFTGWVEEPFGLASLPAGLDPMGASGVLLLNPTNVAGTLTRTVLEGERVPWQGGSQTVAFADFWMKPVAEFPTNAATSVSIDGARIGFVLDGGMGRPFVFDGDGSGSGTAQDTAYTFEVDASGASSNWVRVTVRRDFASSQFDVWFDGTLYAAAAGPDELATNAQSAPALFVVDSSQSAAAWLDLYSLGPDNPLFPDADRDGIPTAIEGAFGLNPNLDDRDGDSDNDGAPNIAEYAMGTAPDDPASLPDATNLLVYVDGILGDDNFNGLASHPSAIGGPKRTLTAGMDASGSSSLPSPVVVIRGSTNSYSEQAIAPGTNSIVLRPIGNVKIQP